MHEREIARERERERNDLGRLEVKAKGILSCLFLLDFLTLICRDLSVGVQGYSSYTSTLGEI